MVKTLVHRFIIFVILSNLYHSPTVQADIHIPLGAIIEEGNTKVRQILELAVDQINRNQTLLPNVNLTMQFYHANIYQQYRNLKKGCLAANDQVWTIIGPTTSSDVECVQYMATSVSLPQIAPVASYPGFDNRPSLKYLLRMSPSDYWQSKVLASIFQSLNWPYAALLASNTDYGINSVAEFQVIAAQRGWKILAYEIFNVQETNDVNLIRKRLKKIQDSGVHIIILICLSSQADIIVSQAHRMGLTSKGYQWLFYDNTITEGRLHSNPPRYLEGAIGMISNPNRDNPVYRKIESIWKKDHTSDLDPFSLRYYDAVLAFAYGLQKLLPNISRIAPTMMSCDKIIPWANGNLLMHSIKTSVGAGVTGPIQFGINGSPINPSFQIVNLINQTWKNIGKWSKDSGASIDINKIVYMGHNLDPTILSTGLKGVNLSIVTTIDPPFMNLINSSELYGNNRFEGIVKDLLVELSKMLQFTYKLSLTEDRNYGSVNETTNQWTGMVKKIIDQKADIAAGAFSITASRSHVIDFTKPFLDQGVTMLVAKPKSLPPSIFQCFAPFTLNVWLLIAGSIIFTGVIFYATGYLSPFDLYGSAVRHLPLHANDSDYSGNSIPRVDKLRWKNYYRDTIYSTNLGNSVWNIISSFLQQGHNKSPNALSGRIITGFWWLASCIIIATYTANLAAFLTIDRLNSGKIYV
ncbi:Glutamate receptor ionotropic, kainate 2 [Trichoplax sp. H2]|nr:Glutamate receptor ionotropic, kainate 2 [Trichoplax sp. H2]|eukprot:RDD46626.1 Glutamate receptor ionotropic, kainate 2 [Trichoplax sp. H2]